MRNALMSYSYDIRLGIVSLLYRFECIYNTTIIHIFLNRTSFVIVVAMLVSKSVQDFRSAKRLHIQIFKDAHIPSHIETRVNVHRTKLPTIYRHEFVRITGPMPSFFSVLHIYTYTHATYIVFIYIHTPAEQTLNDVAFACIANSSEDLMICSCVELAILCSMF